MKAMLTKILSLLLVVTVTAGVAIGGTLAWLTDRDSEANVFTVGNVEIDLNEDFEQGSTLIPGVDIEKEVQITNTGKNDAYVWYTYAIPSALDTENDASKNIIHVNHAGANWLGYQNNTKYWAAGQTEPTPEDQCWIVDYNPSGNGYPIGKTEIDGVEYNVYAVLYNGILPADETTTVGMTKVYMDTNVDIDPSGDWYLVEKGVATKIAWNSNTAGNPVIYVSAYAIQSEGFKDAATAFAAYYAQWDDDGMLSNGSNGDEYEGVTNAKPESGAVRPAGYSPAVEGEVIDGLNIMDYSDEETNLRALYREGGINGSLTVLNSVLDGTYAMNITTKGENATLVCENTTFMGWVSYDGFASATFTDCTFRLNSEGTYNYLRAYDATTFVGCEFKDTTLDVAGNGSITLVNCTMNGTLIENASQLNLAEGVTVAINNG